MAGICQLVKHPFESASASNMSERWSLAIEYKIDALLNFLNTAAVYGRSACMLLARFGHSGTT